MILSYFLGILFFALSVFAYYKVSENIFDKENWMAIIAVLLFALDKWLIFISVSGMETTLFIFLIIANFYYYRKRNPVMFAVTFGLIFWTRPDGIAYLGVVILDYLLLMYFKNKAAKQNTEPMFSSAELKKIFIVFGILLIAYFAMNLLLSGSLLPNTYNAKLTYYSPEFRSRADFLKNEVWNYFTYSSYVILIIPFIISLLFIGSDLFKKRYNRFFIPALFIFALIFIYWYKLPYAHRFGRYLMPVIPFYIMLFIYGSRQIFILLTGYLSDKKIVNALNIILFSVAILFFASDSIFSNDQNIGKTLYQSASRHITIRQVEAAKWLLNNTPENAVIATHDVGAIAFYSNRKIVDVAGLINPEFTPNLLDINYANIMQESMNKYGVTHVAFLREWYQIVNQKPLFVTGENNFEIMEIHKYEPGRSHVLNTMANSGNKYAMELLQNRQIQQAISVLNQTLALDPQSSQTYYLLGVAYALMNDVLNSEKNLRKSLELFPDFSEAAVSLADLYNKRNNRQEARNILNGYLKNNPNDTLASKYLISIKDSVITPGR
jgi:tetratricopeptide (TPR) repeat protein